MSSGLDGDLLFSRLPSLAGILLSSLPSLLLHWIVDAYYVRKAVFTSKLTEHL